MATPVIVGVGMRLKFFRTGPLSPVVYVFVPKPSRDPVSVTVRYLPASLAFGV